MKALVKLDELKFLKEIERLVVNKHLWKSNYISILKILYNIYMRTRKYSNNRCDIADA